MIVADKNERAVVAFWRKGHLSCGTIVIYLQWVRRFKDYCNKRKLVEIEQLTAVGVQRFTRAYDGPRLKGQKCAKDTRNVAGNALHAWACALDAMGTKVPLWRDKREPKLSPLLNEYCHYRRAHSGVSETTLVRDVETAQFPRTIATYNPEHSASSRD